MGSSTSLRLSVVGLVAIAIAGAWAWSQRPTVAVEKPPTTMAPDETAAPTAPPPAPPQPAEVEAKFERLFGPVARWAGGPFAAGDFNGDGWGDLAAVLSTPREQLARLNAEPSNWILRDPIAAGAARPTQPPPRPVIDAETVLAIVHGYQAAGWRNPDAQQTYVLAGAAGRDLQGVPIRSAGAEAGMRVVEGRAGEVLMERLGDQRGFLYWDGARYVWTPIVHSHTSPVP